MGSNDYVQFQFSLPSLDLNPGFLGELANILGLPYDEEDFEEKWFNRDKTDVYVIQDINKDTNTFILVQLLAEGEFDGIVLRFGSEYVEKVKEVFLEVRKSGFISDYVTGQQPPVFRNVLHHPERDWVPKFIERYNLNINCSLG
ncbi:hypothetical protein [Laceyella tengchongensis]|uniref:hypothetical protein n=1 Tax=Laceyella tengchongensis TaxID=574699 RepID=UPI000F4DF248|nr:hypothetical protein [Laceyella tengchongensis]